MKGIDQLDFVLVDDNEVHRSIIEKKIRKMGAKQVVTISTFEDACNYLKSHNPDIVLSDYHLDENLTGEDLINTCLANKNIPVILMSSFFDIDNLSSFEKNPLVGYLQKTPVKKNLKLLLNRA